MKDKVFLDTNVLLYLFDIDGTKKEIAKRLLNSRHTISTQVLNEFANVALRKLKLSSKELEMSIQELVSKTTLFLLDENSILGAIKIKEKYKLQYYDSLIIATALDNKCTIVYSEDMQHNQLIEENLKIINPFKK